MKEYTILGFILVLVGILLWCFLYSIDQHNKFNQFVYDCDKVNGAIVHGKMGFYNQEYRCVTAD